MRVLRTMISLMLVAFCLDRTFWYNRGAGTGGHQYPSLQVIFFLFQVASKLGECLCQKPLDLLILWAGALFSCPWRADSEHGHTG